jgi:hypothetical protein
MHLGRLDEAVEGYKDTIRLAGRIPGDTMTLPLATWGLAVALDRSGDHVGGEREARKALEREQSAHLSGLLHIPDKVFFVPAYEVEWYEGLGDVGLARVMKEPADQVTAWADAEKHFSAYVKAAEAAKEKDRFLEIAKARLVAIKAARAEAEKRKAKAPPPKKEEDEEPSPVTF